MAVPPSTQAPTFSIVVMGPSGCGKSTLGRALAEALGWRFVEGDEHHTPENRAKMAGGEPLSDTDRLPFLEAIGRGLKRGPAVASCSALRRAHRDVLRAIAGDILFVLPVTCRADLALRMRRREGHFMPAELLDSQLALLEPPGSDEWGLALEAGLPTAEQVQVVLRHLCLA